MTKRPCAGPGCDDRVTQRNASGLCRRCYKRAHRPKRDNRHRDAFAVTALSAAQLLDLRTALAPGWVVVLPERGAAQREEIPADVAAGEVLVAWWGPAAERAARWPGDSAPQPTRGAHDLADWFRAWAETGRDEWRAARRRSA